MEDIISKLELQKSSVVRHMTPVLHALLEKGIISHSIVHRALMEYLTIADKVLLLNIVLFVLLTLKRSIFFLIHTCLSDWNFVKSSATDVLQQLPGQSFIRMLHTKDGSRLGILCIRHGTAKVQNLSFRSFLCQTYIYWMSCWRLVREIVFNWLSFRIGRKLSKAWKVKLKT